MFFKKQFLLKQPEKIFSHAHTKKNKNPTQILTLN